MAMLPSKCFVGALAVGLALTGAALVGPEPLGESARYASAFALVGAPAFEDPPPPPPDTEAPQTPAPRQAGPPTHRRHIDGDPILQR
ncbi:MAG: hypothetical protein QOD34_3106 [Mycobacterium sp.]|jgi:hypothetical protein|nr:hypothetical protein [Mycobacterium sp.]